MRVRILERTPAALPEHQLMVRATLHTNDHAPAKVCIDNPIHKLQHSVVRGTAASAMRSRVTHSASARRNTAHFSQHHL